jgi:cytoskeleton protein RodZ
MSRLAIALERSSNRGAGEAAPSWGGAPAALNEWHRDEQHSGRSSEFFFVEGVNAMPAAEISARTSSVGGDLRLARQRLGWERPALAARLRIRDNYLAAIEDGRLDDLPGNAYAVGFLRTYAAAVGLDADEIARRFRAEVSDVNTATKLVFPAPVPERGVPALAVVLVGLVIVIGGYAAWYRYGGSREATVEAVPAVPERLALLAPPPTNAASNATAPTSPSGSPVPASPSPASSVGSPASPTAPNAALNPAIVIPTPVQVPVSTVPGAIPTAPTPPAADTQSSAPDAARSLASLNPDGGRLALKATAQAWIQLRDKATNTVVLERTLNPGEVLPIPNRSGLLLTTGNAGGTQVLLDGQATPSLGGDGAVRRGLPMEVDAVRQGLLSPAAVPSSGQPGAQPRPATTN